MRTTLLRRAAPAVVVALAVLAPFAPAWVGGRQILWADTFRLYAPVRHLVADALRAGHLPLWNPYSATGMPLFAEAMHGVLHPVSLLTAAVDPAGHVDPLIFGYLVLAALGSYALARALGTSTVAAVLAGIAYALCGYVVSMSTNLVYLAGAASLPWLLAAGRAVGTGARGAAAVAVATALGALAGEFQSLMFGLVVALVLAAEGGGRRAVLRAAAGEILGLALAAVQLVPSWIHLGRTVRSRGVFMLELREWALSPWRLVEWISPGFFMRFDRDGDAVYGALGKFGLMDFPFASSVFIGAPVLLLAARGVRGRTGRVLLACACVALWLALGHQLGAAALLSKVPLWGKFRYAEKLMGPVSLLVAVLAARGLDAVRGEGAGRAPERWAWGVAVVGAIGGGVAALGGLDTVMPVAGKRLASGATWVVAGSTATALLLRAARSHPRSRRAALAAIAAVVWIGSATATQFAYHAGLPFDGAAITRRIPADVQLTRLATPFGGPGPPVEGGDDFDRTNRSEGRLGMPNYNVQLGVDALDVYTGLVPMRYANVRWAFLDERWLLFRRFGATHAVIPWPTDAQERRVAEIATTRARLLFRDARERVDVWELPHREWATFAGALSVAPGPTEALDGLRRIWAQRSDAAIVEARESDFGTAPGRVAAIERHPERLRIEAEADGEGFLVVNDAYSEGWEAEIDGRPVPIHPVDALVRGVRWPPGRHVLTMAYRPPEVAAGLAVTAAALVVIGALVVVERRRRRGRPPHGGPGAC